MDIHSFLEAMIQKTEEDLHKYDSHSWWMFLMHRLELFNNFRLIEEIFDRFSKESLNIARNVIRN